MRLIDADALRKRILRARWGGWIRGDVLEQILDSEPTVDPVVRCKDCIYWDGTYCADFCTTDPDGYCSWGERRKDGQEMQ